VVCEGGIRYPDREFEFVNAYETSAELLQSLASHCVHLSGPATIR
jgi:hypothetical protein